MEEAIAKADTLIEALSWIRQFRHRITVIKLGGSVMESDTALRHVLIDIVFMETVGMYPVLVHGGGAAVSRAMREAGLEARFIHGRRYTDDATLGIVEQVLATGVNEQIARDIEEYGGCARNFNFQTTNVLFGEKTFLRDERGERIDLGHVGGVTRVDGTAIEEACEAGQVPVIPSMCIDESGQKYNVNADTAAMAVARALNAEKLVYLSDVNGVRRNKSDPGSLIHSLTVAEAREMIAQGSIEAGMIPKVEACLATLEEGVGKVHIIDGRLRHSLLLEIYTNKGVGTQILRDPVVRDGME
ncbi:MAG: acetylglutamate kinase [Planctomycetota bacterium]